MAAACLVEGVDTISVHASEVAEAPSVASAVATTIVGVDVESGGVGGVRAGGVERVGDVEAIANGAIENLAVVAGEGGGLERVQGDDLEKHLQAGGGKGGDIRCAAGCGIRACTLHKSQTGHGVTCWQSAVAAPASTGGGAQSDRGQGLPLRSELREKPREMKCWEPTIETTGRARVRSNASLQILQFSLLLWSKNFPAEGNAAAPKTNNPFGLIHPGSSTLERTSRTYLSCGHHRISNGIAHASFPRSVCDHNSNEGDQPRLSCPSELKNEPLMPGIFDDIHPHGSACPGESYWRLLNETSSYPSLHLPLALEDLPSPCLSSSPLPHL